MGSSSKRCGYQNLKVLLTPLSIAGLLIIATCCSAADSSVGTEPAPAKLGDSPRSAEILPALPTLDQLPAADGENRSASYLNRSSVRGIDFIAGTASPDGSYSASLSAPGLGSRNVNWVIYRLPMRGVAPQRIIVQWNHNSFPEEAPGFMTMHADFATGRWQADGLSLDEYTSLIALSGSPSVSPQGHAYIALICFDQLSAIIDSVYAFSDDDHSLPVIDNGSALHVGPGQAYADIDSAYGDVAENGMIIVHPQPGNAPYMSPHLLLAKAGISFVADNSTLPAGERVKLHGGGYNYTGAGSVPRAVFQFNPGANGGLVQGFEISDAHNDSFNGAAVRINQANDVRIVGCEIHGCDMGIMSNGDGVQAASGQMIISCVIHENGNLSDPGYNHNLYLGGHDATLRHCEVYGALTGHNVKSRAHVNRLEYCYIHDSANREIDFVDSADTELPDSDSLLLGCVIVKADNMDGNKHMIHFGQDGGHDHTGRLYIANCTLVSPYLSPFVQLTAASARLYAVNSIFWGTASPASGQTLFSVANGAEQGECYGEHNWIAAGIDVPAFWENESLNFFNSFGTGGEDPPFAAPNEDDYHLLDSFPGITDSGMDLHKPSQFVSGFSYYVKLPGLLDEYRPVACGSIRPVNGVLDVGAFEYRP